MLLNYILYSLLLIIAAVNGFLFVFLEPWLKTYMYILTISFIVGIGIWQLSGHRWSMLRIAFHKNVFLIIYLILYLIIQLLFHTTSIFDGLRIIAYALVSIFTYLLFPLLLLSDPRRISVFLQVNVCIGILLAFSAFIGSFGFDSLLGLPLANKSHLLLFGLQASGGFLEHPISLGFYMIICITCCIYLINNTKKMKLFYDISIVIFLLCIIATQSRGAMLSLTVGILFIFFPKNWLKYRFIMLSFIAVSVSLLYLTYKVVLHYPTLASFLRLDHVWVLSGRTSMWFFGLELLSENPFLGYGIYNMQELLASFDQSTLQLQVKDFHNTFIGSAVGSGIVVTFFYSIIFILPFLRVIKTEYINPALKRAMIFFSIAALVAVFFQDYNIGGVRLVSICMAILLGIANLAPVAMQLQKLYKKY